MQLLMIFSFITWSYRDIRDITYVKKAKKWWILAVLYEYDNINLHFLIKKYLIYILIQCTICFYTELDCWGVSKKVSLFLKRAVKIDAQFLTSFEIIQRTLSYSMINWIWVVLLVFVRTVNRTIISINLSQLFDYILYRFFVTNKLNQE